MKSKFYISLILFFSHSLILAQKNSKIIDSSTVPKKEIVYENINVDTLLINNLNSFLMQNNKILKSEIRSLITTNNIFNRRLYKKTNRPKTYDFENHFLDSNSVNSVNKLLAKSILSHGYSKIDSINTLTYLINYNFLHQRIQSKRNLISQSFYFNSFSKKTYEILLSFVKGDNFDIKSFESNVLNKLEIYHTIGGKQQMNLFRGHLPFLIHLNELVKSEFKYANILPDKILNIKESQKDELKRLIERYLEIDITSNYQLYSEGNLSSKAVKGLYFDHGNDILFPINNLDRDMTGSFRFEVFTDYLKMRIFNKTNKADILSYQGLFFGGEGYTPFIRYDPTKMNFSNNDITKYNFTIENGYFNEGFVNQILQPVSNYIQKETDRPFSSFQYFGRSKYRIPYHGFWRIKSDIKIGSIGKNLGRDIQALIHQDLNPSLKVLNWETQIGYPGKIGINFFGSRERLFFTKGDKVKYEKGNYLISKTIKNRKSWLNLYNIYEGNLGTVNTDLSIGMGLSTKNFLNLSGTNDAYYDSRLPKNNFFFKVDFKAKFQIHNSLIQGLGIFESFDNSAFSGAIRDGFVLQPNELNRFVFTANSQISYRFKKVSLTYRMNANTQDFKRKDYNNLNYTNFKEKIINNSPFNKEDIKQDFLLKILNEDYIRKQIRVPKVNYTGTISLNFLIQ